MTVKEKKKAISIRLRPQLLSEIEEMCKTSSLVSRTAVIEEACRIFLDESAD